MEDIRVLFVIVIVISLFGMVPLLGRFFPMDLPEDDDTPKQKSKQ